jgi:5'-nucleotidase
MPPRKQVEKLFGVSGEDVCYIGDHIFTDVNVAKVHQKWKTVLIVREFEDEV